MKESRLGLWLIGIGIALMAFGLAIRMAGAHSWYDGDCCSEHDCFEVKGVVRFDDTSFILPNGERVPRNGGPQIRVSRDQAYHVCRLASGGIRCLYVPEGGGT